MSFVETWSAISYSATNIFYNVQSNEQSEWSHWRSRQSKFSSQKSCTITVNLSPLETTICITIRSNKLRNFVPIHFKCLYFITGPTNHVDPTRRGCIRHFECVDSNSIALHPFMLSFFFTYVDLVDHHSRCSPNTGEKPCPWCRHSIRHPKRTRNGIAKDQQTDCWGKGWEKQNICGRA